MARYEREYQGIRGDAGQARGMDPNFRGGEYRGMPYHVEPGQAPYGSWRWHHRQDLGGSGGFRGRYDRDVRGGGYDSGYSRDRRPESRPREYDDGVRASGGVRSFRYDRELLRDFNAASSELHRQRGDYDRGGPRRAMGHDPGPEAGLAYHNRGLSRGGFSESWAKGPRGAR
jgi:hypothetical protein